MLSVTIVIQGHELRIQLKPWHTLLPLRYKIHYNKEVKIGLQNLDLF